MSALILMLSLAGLGCLAVSIPRHCRHVFGRDLARPFMLILRGAGCILLAASWAASIARWGGFLGSVTWLGIQTAVAVAVTLLLTYGARIPWLRFGRSRGVTS